MTAHIPENEVGRAADAEAALSPLATAPVVAALPGNDQPRDCGVVSDPTASAAYRARWIAVRDAIMWNLQEPVLRNLNAMHVMHVALGLHATTIEDRGVSMTEGPAA